MNRYVVKDGAVLVCTFGSMEGTLKVPDYQGSKVKGGNEAVITDVIPEVNIPAFGICSCPAGQGPCVPETISPWINGKEDFTIGHIPAVMDDGILPCLKGGIISIKNHGQ